MSNALVLGGGGCKGAYQIGAIRALHELGYKYDIVTGTSVGALNALFLATEKFALLEEVWKNIDYSDVMEYEHKWKNKSAETFVNSILKGGLKLTPLEKLIEQHLNIKKLKQTSIKSGIVYTRGGKYTPIVINEADENKIKEYLISSCSAIPFLKGKKIDGKNCYDGFYSDNLPVKLAIDMGASKIIAIDLIKGFRQKTDLKNVKYYCIKPSKKTGFFLNFDNENINKIIELGYKDVIENKEKILDFINS